MNAHRVRGYAGSRFAISTVSAGLRSAFIVYFYTGQAALRRANGGAAVAPAFISRKKCRKATVADRPMPSDLLVAGLAVGREPHRAARSRHKADRMAYRCSADAAHFAYAAGYLNPRKIPRATVWDKGKGRLSCRRLAARGPPSRHLAAGKRGRSEPRRKMTSSRRAPAEKPKMSRSAAIARGDDAPHLADQLPDCATPASPSQNYTSRLISISRPTYARRHPFAGLKPFRK